MIKKIILTKWEPSFIIENEVPFTRLRMKSATSVEGVFRTDEVPFIAIKLNNNMEAFNLRMNLVPGSNQYNCFDVLETAAQVPNLANVSFDALEIAIPEHQYDGGFTVIIEVEME